VSLLIDALPSSDGNEGPSSDRDRAATLLAIVAREHSRTPNPDIAIDEWLTAMAVHGPDRQPPPKGHSNLGTREQSTTYVLVRPLWAFAAFGAACAAVAVLVTLIVTSSVSPLSAAFLGAFAIGLSTSSAGMLFSASRHGNVG